MHLQIKNVSEQTNRALELWATHTGAKTKQDALLALIQTVAAPYEKLLHDALEEAERAEKHSIASSGIDTGAKME